MNKNTLNALIFFIKNSYNNIIILQQIEFYKKLKSTNEIFI
jgi:hypothetical protein